jgi:thiosulfate/3-mercaptopyruvate sulfurtransferase
MIAMLRPEDNSTPFPKSRWLVSTDWLAEHLQDRSVIAVDSSYFLPGQQRDAHAEYRDGHIPGAVFFDIDKIADGSSDLPHTLPGPAYFSEAIGALGIGDGDTVVVYDSVGLFSAARVWWTFRIFGAKKAFILDGGLPKWKAEGRPLEKGDAKRAARKFNAEMNVGAVATLSDMRMAVTDDNTQVVDARSAGRFAGTEPEPRPDLRPGHMPRAFNLPYGELIENGQLVSRARIEAAFKNAGIDLEKPVITTCGSGVTAAILTLALETIGKEPQGLYDGSWAEWGSRPDVPVERG